MEGHQAGRVRGRCSDGSLQASRPRSSHTRPDQPDQLGVSQVFCIPEERSAVGLGQRRPVPHLHSPETLMRVFSIQGTASVLAKCIHWP